MRTNLLLLVYVILVSSTTSHAQGKQGAWWIFGSHIGINFNSNPPEVNYTE